jgi:hypothetical protein
MATAFCGGIDTESHKKEQTWCSALVDYRSQILFSYASYAKQATMQAVL